MLKCGGDRVAAASVAVASMNRQRWRGRDGANPGKDGIGRGGGAAKKGREESVTKEAKEKDGDASLQSIPEDVPAGIRREWLRSGPPGDGERPPPQKPPP